MVSISFSKKAAKRLLREIQNFYGYGIFTDENYQKNQEKIRKKVREKVRSIRHTLADLKLNMPEPNITITTEINEKVKYSQRNLRINLIALIPIVLNNSKFSEIDLEGEIIKAVLLSLSKQEVREVIETHLKRHYEKYEIEKYIARNFPESRIN